jgi:hypothetical protein
MLAEKDLHRQIEIFNSKNKLFQAPPSSPYTPVGRLLQLLKTISAVLSSKTKIHKKASPLPTEKYIPYIL